MDVSRYRQPGPDEISAIREQMSETSGIGIYRYTFDGTVIFIDRGALRIFDLESVYPDPRMAIGRNIADLIVYTGQKGRVRDELRKHGRVSNFEYPYKTVTGKLRWALHDSFLVVDPNTNEKIIQAIIRDVTELKLVQHKLQQERIIRETAIEILPFPLGIVTMRAGRPTMSLTNRAFDELMRGISDADWWSISHVFSPETRLPIPREDWPVFRALKGETPDAVEAILDLPSRPELFVLLVARPVFVNGELFGALMAIQDITDLKAADRAKDEFLAVVSHELKTPLTSILGWVQLAQDGDMSRLTKALKVIKRNALRQRRLLDDLIDVSRIVHGKFIMRPTSVELWELVAHSVEEILATAEARKIRIEMIPPSSPLPVHVDALRIRQVVANLLSNAIKFTPSGGTITVTGRRVGDYGEITVKDTGRGIEADVLPRLFKPFQQGPRLEEVGGLGLGLALVKGILSFHAGAVFAESPGKDQGSTFTFKLPIHVAR